MAIPFAPPVLYGHRSNPNVRDLYLMQGQEQADLARRQGDIWSNAMMGVGQSIAGGIEKHQERKQQNKNEQALLGAMETWDDADPQGSAMRIVQVVGPKEGLRLAEGFHALRNNAKNEDPKSHLATATGGMEFFASRSPEGKARAWPMLRQTLAPTAVRLGFDPNELPEEYGPEVDELLGGVKKGIDGYLGREAKKDEGPKAGSLEAFVGSKGALTPEQQLEARQEWEAAGRAPAKPEKALSERITEERLLSAARAAGTASVKPPKEVQDDTAEVQAWVDSISRGEDSMASVPAKLRSKVRLAAETGGVDSRSPKQREIDAGADALLTSLDQMESQAKKTMTSESGPGAMAAGTMGRALDYVGLSEKTRLWDAQVGKMAQMARAMGEKGAMSNQDVERALSMLPKLTDPENVRDQKMRGVREILMSSLTHKVSDRVTLDPEKRRSSRTKSLADRLRQKYGEEQ